MNDKGIRHSSLKEWFAEIFDNRHKDAIEHLLVLTYEFDDQQLVNLVTGRSLEEDYQIRLSQLKIIARLRPVVPWICLKDFNEYHPDYMEFCSRFSRHALYSFYDRHYTQIVSIIREFNDGDRCDNKYKALIRRFAADQDSNEANVYVLGMNSLRKPRLDSWQFRRLNTYYTGFLLKNRWQTSRKTVVDFLEKNRLLSERPAYQRKSGYYDWIADLSRRDMFGLREAVEYCINNEHVQSEWNEIYTEIIMAQTKNVTKIRSFYKNLSSQILKEKLRIARIGLCVIDEVHNWKNGSNGATEFCDHYAENIPNKLIMSATPFQIHEDELRNIFSYLDGKKNLSSDALARIYQGVNLLQACIDKSSAFQTAWRDLEDNDVEVLNNAIESSHIKSDTSIMNKLRECPSFSETLSAFIQKASDYKKAVEKLKSELSLFVVRHTKGRMKRDYHIGRSYRTSQLDPAVPCRTSLYSTSGYANTADAFINFMAIRLDQKIRQDTQARRETNAHLMGGITSSTAAFRESNQQLCKLKGVSPDTKDYQQLFLRMLDHHVHPKVSATVERVFKNYCEGRKTLIFCERRATLKEINEALRDKIHKYIEAQSDRDVISRNTVLRNHAFVDNYWWRSFLYTLEPSLRMTLKYSTSKILPDVRQSIINELAVKNEVLTPRQILRKIDFALFEQLARKVNASCPFRDALQLFTELSQADLDSGGSQIIEEAEADAVLTRAENIINDYLSAMNIWFGPEDKSEELHICLWKLLDSECKRLKDIYKDDKEQRVKSLGGMLIDIERGLRKIVLRDDLLSRFQTYSGDMDNYSSIKDGIYSKIIGSETIHGRLLGFLESLNEANGSIISKESTKRLSLWQGVFRHASKDDNRVGSGAVDVLHGDIDRDARVKLCAAFNSPLQPDILVCTAIGSEGIDLHRQCAEIIHHDLPWNPAKLEQRIGRIDRVGSLAEVSPARFIQIGIPFLEHNYERYQYDLLFKRAQMFEILMGEPDFDVNDQDEEKIDEIKDDSVKKAKEQDCDIPNGNAADIKLAHLPEEIMDYLRIDLSLSD